MQAKRTLATIALLVSCALLGPAFARADTTFDVSGTAHSVICGGTCAFSGTLMVDTVSGTRSPEMHHSVSQLRCGG